MEKIDSLEELCNYVVSKDLKEPEYEFDLSKWEKDVNMRKKAGEKIAIEIETGNCNAIENVRKCLEIGFDVVISVPVNRKTETKIKEQLKSEGLDKTVFVVRAEKFE